MALWENIRDSFRAWWGGTTSPPEEGTPEFDWHAANIELQRGNLRHGAKHLACLLSLAPDRPDWRGLADTYLAAAERNPELLLCGARPGPHSEAYFADEALRAYVLAEQGDVELALELLTQVVDAAPDSMYLECWGLEWMERPGVLEQVPSPVFYLAIAKMQIRYAEHAYLTASQLRPLRRALQLVRRFQQQRPASPDELVWLAALHRKLGQFQTALQVGRAAYEADASWQTAVPCGLALRELGEIERARQTLQQALAHDPEDISARLEIGDMYLEDEQWDEASAWYEQVLAREPDHSWAKSSLAYCDFQQGREETAAATLNQQRRQSCLRAQQLVERLLPYSGSLPEPSDATANLLRQLLDRLRQAPEGVGGGLKVQLSHIEPPSNMLAYEMAMRSAQLAPQLEVEVENVPRPDPRKPDGHVDLLLWRYRGTTPRPALPRPGEEVLERIEALACEPYEPRRNWARASLAAEALGPPRVREIAAAMVHPPPLPPGWSALEWIPRVQLVAAQVIAHLDGDGEPVLARQTLFDLLHGPIDWTTVAVIVTLTQLAAAHPCLAAEVDAEFARLDLRQPDSGACSFEHALYYHWCELPGLEDARRQQLLDALQEIEEQ